MSGAAGKLEGKVVIITGAGSGLGRASALLFAEEGARVVISDINAERAALVTEEIHGKGGRAGSEVDYYFRLWPATGPDGRAVVPQCRC